MSKTYAIADLHRMRDLRRAAKHSNEYAVPGLEESGVEQKSHYALDELLSGSPYYADNSDKYETLSTILDAAFDHAATGKGKERHARDLPFDKQPMLETTRLVGPGFPLGQAIKKAGEAAGMIEREEYDAAVAECLGAINYLAGAVAWVRERKNERKAA